MKGLWDQVGGLEHTEGIYRAAFPAFRIFIYGREVSGDVVEVRVNQSGGSQDRAPSTCSFTLVNPQDKYIVDHQDMIVLGYSRDKLFLKQNLDAYKKWVATLENSSGEDVNTVQEFFNMMGASGQYSEIVDDMASLYKNMKELGRDYEMYWEEGNVPDLIKLTVLEKKAPLLIPESQKVVEYLREGANAYANAQYLKDNLLYVYPFREGDCIFHANDPIRIAFRDPFNPSIWYWQFTGFMDSFTENVGVNQESTVTITGTDVTKIVRYSMMQTNAMMLCAGSDEGIRKLFADNPAFAGKLAKLNWIPYQEMFAGFTIFEILEILFFGLEAFIPSVKESTERAINLMSEDEVNVYLFNSYSGLSKEDVASMTPAHKKADLIKFMLEDKRDRFPGAHIPAVSTPRGVSFRRKDNKYGVNALFVGDELDGLDKALGEGISVGNLRLLNDKLHHRVRIADMHDMAVELPYQFPAMVSAMTVDEVITEIGQNHDKYPVGYGKVYYVAPAKLGPQISRGVLDGIMGGSAVQHSEFKDRLSFLYDLADVIEFRFYATPKGDVVFEMPFFDFDHWQFDNLDPNVSNREIESEETVFRQGYLDLIKPSDKYTEDDLREMMSASSELEIARAGFIETYASQYAYTHYMYDYSYTRAFTIEKHETLGFSNSMNDQGVKTVWRAMPHHIKNYSGADMETAKKPEYVAAPDLAPTLGFRFGEDNPKCGTATQDGAKLFANLCLRRANAEARNIGIPMLPTFGLMVNRPLYWRERNYQANVVSAQHSIVVNSSCDSTVNLNYAKGWTGSYDSEKRETYAHFGGELPFNLAAILSNRK